MLVRIKVHPTKTAHDHRRVAIYGDRKAPGITFDS